MNRLVLVLMLLAAGSFAASCLPKHEIARPPQSRAPSPNASAPRTSAPGTSAPSITGISYIETYKDIAISEMNKYGIPASIKLAQALLESGNGNSRLAREANNHFGIKCAGEWSGGRSFHDDDERNECFRAYRRPEESFADHSQFLLRKRYENLFQLDRNDYKGWAKGLKSAGYATNPRYAELLIDLIERYELYQYDRPEFGQSKDLRDATVKQEILQSTTATSTPPPTQKRTVMKIHEVTAGESATTIASKYGISVEVLLDRNGLKSTDLHIGQMLVVSP